MAKESRSQIFHRINPRGVAHGATPVATVEGAVASIDSVCEAAKKQIIAAVVAHAQAHPDNPWSGAQLVDLERTVKALYASWGQDIKGTFKKSLPKVMQEFVDKAKAEMKTAGRVQHIIGKPDTQRVQWHLNSSFDQVAMRTDKMAFDHIAQLRRISAEVIRTASLTGQTRKEVSRQLLNRAVTEIPGFQFIDNAGRKWKDKSYFEMLARTELMNAGRASYDDTCAKNGFDVVQLTFSGHSCKACTEYEGHLFSLTGATPGLPTKDDLLDAGVFHPNCTHSYTAVSDYDRETGFDEKGNPLSKEEAEERRQALDRQNDDWLEAFDRKHQAEKNGVATGGNGGREDAAAQSAAKAEAEARAKAEEAARAKAEAEARAKEEAAAKAAAEARAKEEAEAKARAEEAAKAAAQAAEAARKAEEQAKQAEEAARKAAEEAARLEKERVAKEEAAKRKPAAKHSEERKEEPAKAPELSTPEKDATADKEETTRQEKERLAAEEAAHKAHRQAQWQKAYEKRRDDWKAQCEQAIPVAQSDPKYQDYLRLVNMVVAQYTPQAAKIGKPPRLAFLPDDGKPSCYNPYTYTIELHASNDQYLHDWYNSYGTIRHEWGHWGHFTYFRKHPEILKDITKAGRKDWTNIKTLYNGNMSQLEDVNIHSHISKKLYNKAFVSLSLEERKVVGGFADAIEDLSNCKYGDGHDKAYWKKIKKAIKNGFGEFTHCEAIADVRNMVMALGESQVSAYFPNTVDILKTIGIL